MKMDEKNQTHLMDEEQVQEEEFTLVDYLEPILKNKWEFVTIVAFALLFSLLYNLVATPVYQAQSSVTISLNKATNLIRDRESDVDNRIEQPEFNTKIIMISSQPLVERLVKELIDRGYFQDELKEMDYEKLTSESRENYIRSKANTLRRKLRVDNPDDSNLAVIKFEDTDPAFAKDVVNLLADITVEYNKEEQLQKINSAMGYLHQQIDEARLQVEKAEVNLYKYRLENNIFQTHMDKELIDEQRSEQTQKINEVRVDRRELEAKIDELKELLGRDDYTKYTPVLEKNTVLWDLKTQLVEAEVKCDKLAVTYGRKHPDRIKAEKDVKILERKFERELNVATTSLEYKLEVIKSKEELLQEILVKTEENAVSSTEKDIDYVILEREANSVRDLYKTLLAAVKEMNINANALANNIVMVHEKSGIPSSPIKPNKPLNMMLGLVMGVMIAGVFAYTREYMDTTVRHKEDAQKLSRLPVLPAVPLFATDENGRVPVLKPGNPKSMISESFASLRTHLKVMLPQETSLALAVTSSAAKEGKSFLASNIAISMAMDGKKTILVDCDLHRPKIHKVFEIEKEPGVFDLIVDGLNPNWREMETDSLSVGDMMHLINLKAWTGTMKLDWDSLSSPLTVSYMKGRAVTSNIGIWMDTHNRPTGFPSPKDYKFALDESEVSDFDSPEESGNRAVEFISRYPRLAKSSYFRDIVLGMYTKKTESENLDILTAGSRARNFNEILGSEQMKILIQVLKENYDRVIIDTPPAWPLSDVGVLAPMIDGMLWVVRSGKTPKKMFQNSIQQMKQINPNIVGVILNAVDLHRERYYYGYYGYYYKSHYYEDYLKEDPREDEDSSPDDGRISV